MMFENVPWWVWLTVLACSSGCGALAGYAADPWDTGGQIEARVSPIEAGLSTVGGEVRALREEVIATSGADSRWAERLDRLGGVVDTLEQEVGTVKGELQTVSAKAAEGLTPGQTGGLVGAGTTVLGFLGILARALVRTQGKLRETRAASLPIVTSAAVKKLANGGG